MIVDNKENVYSVLSTVRKPHRISVGVGRTNGTILASVSYILIAVEMFNVLAPFHQNSGAAAAAAAAATGGASTPGNQNGPAGGRGVENMQVTQPCSAPSSPTITSPGALSSTSFCLPTGVNSTSSGGSSVITSTTAADTGDPNWQATKSTVRERNAAMFNNDLMADIRFIVGTDGKYSVGTTPHQASATAAVCR